jgi:predicted RND superfamily exporter protein
MLGFVAVLHVTGTELNMFNLIVIPAAIGIGIDDMVHLLSRYGEEGRGSVLRVVRTTGVAVLLTSLTTAVGFGSALVARHAGLRSLGTTALIAIGFTLLSALVLLPSLLVLGERLTRR